MRNRDQNTKNISLPQLLVFDANSSNLRLVLEGETGTLSFNKRTEPNQACSGTIKALRCILKLCLEDSRNKRCTLLSKR